MKENYYTNNVLKPRFLKMGCKFKKHHGGQFSKGWPDVELRYMGCVINIEVKMNTNKVSDIQANELQDIAKHGGYCLIIRRTYDGKEIITGVGRLGYLLAAELGAEMKRLFPKPEIIFNQNSPYVKEELKKLKGEK